jgi:MFS family permease
MSSTFRSLAGINYRLWFAGALVSNIGTWMQRTAQDWIVLTDLTENDAVAVGITMALQLGPQLLLVPFSGLIADRFDKRRLLLATNLVMGILAAGLGALTLSGMAELWHVYLFALALGITSAIDAPARQAFVSELVSEQNLPNAVSLNSASFNGARLVGPAVAGILTASVGAGWVFLINAITFAATLTALLLLRRNELRPSPRAAKGRGQLLKGLSYVRSRADMVVVFVIVFLVGTFGLNFPIFAATMASVEFHHGAGEFGLLSSVLAIGSVTGALLSARRERPRMRTVILSAGAFGVSLAIASVMPTYWSFAISLILVGFTAITLMTTANGVVQTRTSPEMRGRVMALYLAIFMGGTPLGAPIVGFVANAFGPRWALGVGAFAGLLAAGVGLLYLVRERGLRLRYDRGISLTWTDREQARDKLAADESAVPRG